MRAAGLHSCRVACDSCILGMRKRKPSPEGERRRGSVYVLPTSGVLRRKHYEWWSGSLPWRPPFTIDFSSWKSFEREETERRNASLRADRINFAN